MSKETYCKVYVPLKFLLLNMFVSIFIVSVGFILGLTDLDYIIQGVDYSVSTMVICYGFYSAVSSVLVYTFNIGVLMRNKIKKCIFMVSVMPMVMMCVLHITLSLVLFDLVFSMLLLLPCIFVIATIFFERGTFLC